MWRGYILGIDVDRLWNEEWRMVGMGMECMVGVNGKMKRMG